MPFLICQVSLLTQQGQVADVLSPATPEAVKTGSMRMLYGTLAANLDQYQAPDGSTRTYGLFPEISVRTQGTYRLRVALSRLPM